MALKFTGFPQILPCKLSMAGLVQCPKKGSICRKLITLYKIQELKTSKPEFQLPSLLALGQYYTIKKQDIPM